jgi:hypothetical protein
MRFVVARPDRSVAEASRVTMSSRESGNIENIENIQDNL